MLGVPDEDLLKIKPFKAFKEAREISELEDLERLLVYKLKKVYRPNLSGLSQEERGLVNEYKGDLSDIETKKRNLRKRVKDLGYNINQYLMN